MDIENQNVNSEPEALTTPEPVTEPETLMTPEPISEPEPETLMTPEPENAFPDPTVSAPPIDYVTPPVTYEEPKKYTINTEQPTYQTPNGYTPQPAPQQYIPQTPPAPSQYTPQPPPSPYVVQQQPPQAPAPQVEYTNPPPQYSYYPTGTATASLVLGIVSMVLLLLVLIFPLPLIIMPIVGLILGIVYKTKKYPVSKGVSTAGIILNSLAIVLTIVGIAVSTLFFVELLSSFEGLPDDYYSDFGSYEEYFENYTF
ncbi:MAG: hypothetical protein LBM41_02310 [Ruminococcus sp.]|jgi:hypothetical protein|nr:hypothetical protein [Ruminococcus sp.]